METTVQKKFGLTSSALKVIAISFMIFNHACAVWFSYVSDEPAWLNNFHWYATRLSFILFAFMISEGMIHTHSRKNYLKRLLIFALISELPFDLCFKHTFLDTGHQNVFFTLFLGGLCIALWDRFQNRLFPRVLALCSCMLLAFLLKTDYSFLGVLIIFSFYVFRQDRKRQLLFSGLIFFLGCYLFYAAELLAYGWDFSILIYSFSYLSHYALLEFHGILAFPLIYFYNGQRGKVYPQYVFYALYPGHLFFLYILTIKIRF